MIDAALKLFSFVGTGFLLFGLFLLYRVYINYRKEVARYNIRVALHAIHRNGPREDEYILAKHLFGRLELRNSDKIRNIYEDYILDINFLANFRQEMDKQLSDESPINMYEMGREIDANYLNKRIEIVRAEIDRLDKENIKQRIIESAQNNVNSMKDGKQGVRLMVRFLEKRPDYFTNKASEIMEDVRHVVKKVFESRFPHQQL